MIFYFCILFVTILFCFINKSYSVTVIKNCLSLNINNIVFLSAFICLSAIVGMRDVTVGTDTSHYAFGYKIIASSNLNYDVLVGYSAPLYSLLCKGLSYISTDNIILRMVSAIITYFCFYNCLKRGSLNPFISLFLFVSTFYFTASMNASRQLFATSIACFGLIRLYKDNKFFSGVFLIAISSAIHLSAAVFFIVPITNCIFRNLNVLNTFIFSVILAIVLCSVYDHILTFISDYFTHYKLYTEGDRFNVFYCAYESNLFPLYLFYFACILFYVLSSFKKEYSYDHLNHVFLPILTFATVFGILNPFNEIVFRLLFPIFFLMTIFIANTICIQKYKIKTVLIIFVFIVACACYTYSMLRGWHGVIPYQLYSF